MRSMESLGQAVAYRRCMKTLGLDWDMVREENAVLLQHFKTIAWTKRFIWWSLLRRS
jgi:hypothetical protein